MKTITFNSFDYEGIEEINSGIRMPIFKISNLKIGNNDSKDVLKIDGKTFLFFLSPYFGHFMIEGIFQYEFLKNKIKDLKPFFVFAEDKAKNNPEEFLENYMSDIINMYGGDINLLHHKKFHFEEIYFVFQDVNMFDKSMYEEKDGNRFPWFFEEYWETNIDPTGKMNIRESYGLHDLYTIGAQIFSFKINQILGNDESYPKKIFISRKMTNHKYLFGEERWKQVGQWRMSDLEDIVEDHFIEHGYQPILFENMGYMDQLRYLKNADKISGFVGSCFWSFCVCKKDAAIHEIMSPKQKHGSYLIPLGKLGINDFYMYSLDEGLNRDTVTKEILEEMFDSID
jgi:hypothetical protein